MLSYPTPIQRIRLFYIDGSGPGCRRYVQRERSDLVHRCPCKSLKSRQLLFSPLPFCSEKPIPRQSFICTSSAARSTDRTKQIGVEHLSNLNFTCSGFAGLAQKDKSRESRSPRNLKCIRGSCHGHDPGRPHSAWEPGLAI